MDQIALDTIAYGVTGQNGLAETNFEKIQDYINKALDPDLIMTYDDEIMVFEDNVMVLEDW